MSENTNVFTKDNLDAYLKALAKEYRKLGGKAMPAEIILIGGASIVANYGFRGMTTDVDALIHAASTMKEAINRVGDEYGLPTGWLNADFMKTESYSQKINQYSEFYKQFGGVINVRTVSAEYLIAMKLRAGRKYKNDLSDIIGILAEHESRGKPISMEKITEAVISLYDSYEVLPVDSRTFIEDAMRKGGFTEVYEAICEEEKRAKDVLLKFEAEYPGTMNTQNMESILDSLKKRRK